MRLPLFLVGGLMAAIGVSATGHAATDDSPSSSESTTTTTAPMVTTTSEPATTTTSEPLAASTTGPDDELSIRSAAGVGSPSRVGGNGDAPQVADQPAVADALATRGPAVQLTPTLPAPTFDLPANSGTGRRIVYSNSQMRIWAVEEDGTVVKTHRVSGKRYIPGPGTYYVYSRSLHTYAETNPSIRWMYMVRFAYTPRGGRVGFHEIPTQCSSSGCWKLQTEEQLGEPLSGGCVRQSTPDAIWVWNWAPVGTKVVVLA